MNYSKEEMVSAPTDIKNIEAYERRIGARFPDSFRKRMMESNGALVRTGFTRWWLFPFPDPAVLKPRRVMWLATACDNLPSFAAKAQSLKTFPANAVPIGLRLSRDVDGVLCLLRSSMCSEVLEPTVWAWYWYKKPMHVVATTVDELWKENPYRMPKPRQNWKLKKVKVELPAVKAAMKARKAVGTSECDVDMGWFEASQLRLEGARLSITDGMEIPSNDSKAVDLPPGIYGVALRIQSLGRDRRTSGIRVQLEGRVPTMKRKAFDVAVDTGAIAMFDLPRVLTCEQIVLDALGDKLIDLSMPNPISFYVFGAAQALRVSSGLGDGTYPVYLLLDSNGPFGVEVKFIESALAAEELTSNEKNSMDRSDTGAERRFGLKGQ